MTSLMIHATRYFLIGPMGAGKSSVGRRLAGELGLGFHDTDARIRERTGVDIPLIFEIEGEAGFRRREHDVLSELANREGIVIATGGGIVLEENNREILRRRGVVIHLSASLETLLERTARNPHRPLLQNDDPEGTLARLMAEREPLYRELADIEWPTDGRSVASVARHLADYLQQSPG